MIEKKCVRCGYEWDDAQESGQHPCMERVVESNKLERETRNVLSYEATREMEFLDKVAIAVIGGIYSSKKEVYLKTQTSADAYAQAKNMLEERKKVMAEYLALEQTERNET
jgi:hypothetical protein